MKRTSLLSLLPAAGFISLLGCAYAPDSHVALRPMRYPAAEATPRYAPGVAAAAAPEAAEDIPRTHRPGEFNTEAYDHIVENEFLRVTDQPLSTFSIDVDTASYANVRRFLRHGRRPPRGAVRIEELVNYFRYDYAPPTDGRPFATHVEVAACPWNTAHRLARIGLKGREVRGDSRPSANLVFLLDVSGSMTPANKLPLVRRAMRMLVEQLGENDRVAIVVYAGATGLVLPSTSCDRKEQVLEALERLQAGGSTNGGAGVELAYRTAVEGFVQGGTNRVILCTDGDFNVGVTDRSELVRLVEKNARSGVFLTVLGFGMGNYKDATLEQLADKGNGNYGYVDDEAEARKLLVEQLTGTLVTIAKDVKVQVEFNPAKAHAYRLIGYENRLLAKEDFNDDRKDAGEIGAGHTVTALYEVVPAGGKIDMPAVDPLKYQKAPLLAPSAGSEELLTLKLRYKEPDAEASKLLTLPIRDDGRGASAASADFRFAAAVASFGMLLRDSRHRGNATMDGVIELAAGSLGRDEGPYRREFLDLAGKAKQLMGEQP
ncbi:MAG TPA: VWA domain-containing protein [Phycisphaerae bacterium]|nr:VWA domain-containing protein [Phycisphaerae bacterium]